MYLVTLGFPGDSDIKESASKAGDLDSIPGLGISPGEGNGYSLQYSFLENSMDRGTWWATVHGFSKSCTLLNDYFTVATSYQNHLFTELLRSVLDDIRRFSPTSK